MNTTPSNCYVGSAILGVIVLFFLAFSVYIGGYFLLPDKRGLFQNEWQFKLHEPAMRAQKSITGEPVNSGYVAPNGGRYSKRLK